MAGSQLLPSTAPVRLLLLSYPRASVPFRIHTALGAYVFCQGTVSNKIQYCHEGMGYSPQFPVLVRPRHECVTSLLLPLS